MALTVILTHFRLTEKFLDSPKRTMGLILHAMVGAAEEEQGGGRAWAPTWAPPASSARQCQPPMATCAMVTPLSAVTRRGLRSLPLHKHKVLAKTRKACSSGLPVLHGAL